MTTSIIRTVSFVITKGNTMLMVRSGNNDKLYLPGGKIDEGETLEDAVRREVREELGITSIDSLRLLFEVNAPAHGRENTTVNMHCFTGNITQTPHASHEITELHWVSLADIDSCAPAGQLVMKKILAPEPTD